MILNNNRRYGGWIQWSARDGIRNIWAKEFADRYCGDTHAVFVTILGLTPNCARDVAAGDDPIISEYSTGLGKGGEVIKESILTKSGTSRDGVTVLKGRPMDSDIIADVRDNLLKINGMLDVLERLGGL